MIQRGSRCSSRRSQRRWKCGAARGQPYSITCPEGRVAARYESTRQEAHRERAAWKVDPIHATVESITKQTTVVPSKRHQSRQSLSAASASGRAHRVALVWPSFSGEIDFNSDLQPGDKFRVLVERHTREGKLSGYGAILAAEFVNDGRSLRAIRFTGEDGAPAYYDENGRSLKRFFLKSPLKFEPRITYCSRGSRSIRIRLRARSQRCRYYQPAGAPFGSARRAWDDGGLCNGGGAPSGRHPSYETDLCTCLRWRSAPAPSRPGRPRRRVARLGSRRVHLITTEKTALRHPRSASPHAPPRAGAALDVSLRAALLFR